MTESTNEQASERQDFEDALTEAISALLDDPTITPVSFTVELQASGQHPYRVATTEELYPVIGEVRTEALPDPGPADNTGGAGEVTGGQ